MLWVRCDMKKLQVLGTGCAKCNELTKRVEEAATALGLEYGLEKVSDLKEIMTFEVMMTPALVVEGKLKVAGRVPSVEEIKKMLA